MQIRFDILQVQKELFNNNTDGCLQRIFDGQLFTAGKARLI